MIKVEVELNDFQADVLKTLIPFFGSNEDEVLKSIYIMWINHNYGDTIKSMNEVDNSVLGLTQCDRGFEEK